MTPEHAALVKQELAGKVRATGEYDAIIWKIRAGYVAVLYGSVALLVGRDGVPDVGAIARSLPLAVSIFLLVGGFSVSIFLVDYAYVRQKLKVVVARDALLRWFVRATELSDLGAVYGLLNLSGEDPDYDAPGAASAGRPGGGAAGGPQYDVAREYQRRKRWSLRQVLLPLYSTAPLVAVMTWLAIRLLDRAGRP
jgi:hypothetical protein